LPRDPLDFAENDASEARERDVDERAQSRALRALVAGKAGAVDALPKVASQLLALGAIEQAVEAPRNRPLRLMARQRALVELFPERASRAEQE
jgi:hypothetical protein